MNACLSTRLLLAAAFHCPPADVVPADQFKADEAARQKRARRVALQKERYARRLRYPDLDNTIGF
jgi:hypothetical protein